MTKEVLQHGDPILGSVILCGTFRRIAQLWENAHTLNLDYSQLYLSFTISEFFDFIQCTVFDFIFFIAWHCTHSINRKYSILIMTQHIVKKYILTPYYSSVILIGVFIYDLHNHDQRKWIPVNDIKPRKFSCEMQILISAIRDSFERIIILQKIGTTNILRGKWWKQLYLNFE